MRLFRFSICLALGILIGVFLVTALQSSGYTRDQFVAEFDKNIKRVPIAADVVEHDRDFRARVIAATWEAYSRGDWPAADDALDAMMLAKQPNITWTIIHADDAQLVALWKSYLAVMRRLHDKPATCGYYVSGRRGRGISFPSAETEYRAASAAAYTAYASGERNLARGTAPSLPSPDDAATLLERSTEVGQPYSEVERRALASADTDHVGDSSGALSCAASIKLFENVLALPQADAAAIIRYRWGRLIPGSARTERG